MSEGKRVGFCCTNCLTKYIKERENRLSTTQKGGHWQLLFNGKDLKGFQKPTRTGKWAVKDGILVGSGGAGVLATQRDFRNFELVADIKVHDTAGKRGNSGIFIRNAELIVDNTWPDGLEIQVDHGASDYWTGSLWQAAKAKEVETKDNEWFSVTIEAAGPRIRVWINGELVTDHLDLERLRSGPIAVQVHHDSDVVEIKNLKIRSLQAS